MNGVVTESFIRAVITVGVPLVLGAFLRLRIYASKEEQIFTSKPTNTLRNIILMIFLVLFFLIYSLFATNMKINSVSKLYLFFWNLFFNWFTFGFVLAVSIMLILVRTVLKKLTRKLLFKSDKRRRVILGVLLFSPGVLIFVYSFYSGFLINELVAESKEIIALKVSNTLAGIIHFNKIEAPINYFIMFLVCMYVLIIPMIFGFLIFVIKEKITAQIVLKGGTVLHNKFILNYNLDNSILISDWEGRLGGDKMLIPKSNIEYIKFERTVYILDQQSPESGIVDPRYFDKSEEAKLKEKFLSGISKFL